MSSILTNGSNDAAIAGQVKLPALDVRSQTEVAISDVEPWPEPVEGPVLLEELRGVLKRYAVLPPWACEALALWTLHTYAFELREVSTYVGIESPEKRCGKTTLLSVLNRLVRRPVAAANISSPAFFRVIQELRPTLLIDEADTFLQGNEELRGILNAGSSRETAFVVRVAVQTGQYSGVGKLKEKSGPGYEAGAEVGGNGRGSQGSRLVTFSCWCPKVMARIGRLPDTLADRCIVVRMQRKMAEEPCDRVRNLDGTRLKRQCARFVLDHAKVIAEARPEIPSTLHDRAADIWEPLLVLADLAGGDWPSLARTAAVKLSANAQEHNAIASLLLDIFVVCVKGGGDRTFSRTLVAELNWLHDRPWSAMSKGKGITESWLAQQLRPYGIGPRTVWIGETQGKGYLHEDLKAVFRRYIPRSETEAWKAEHLQIPPEKDAAGMAQ